MRAAFRPSDERVQCAQAAVHGHTEDGKEMPTGCRKSVAERVRAFFQTVHVHVHVHAHVH